MFLMTRGQDVAETMLYVYQTYFIFQAGHRRHFSLSCSLIGPRGLVVAYVCWSNICHYQAWPTNIPHLTLYATSSPWRPCGKDDAACDGRVWLSTGLFKQNPSTLTHRQWLHWTVMGGSPNFNCVKPQIRSCLLLQLPGYILLLWSIRNKRYAPHQNKKRGTNFMCCYWHMFQQNCNDSHVWYFSHTPQKTCCSNPN